MYVTRTHAKTEEHAMIMLTLTPALVLLDSLELTVKQVIFSIVNLISEKYIILFIHNQPMFKTFLKVYKLIFKIRNYRNSATRYK